MWFAPETKSPVTRVVAGCPDGFWRKGDVEIVCERFDAPLCHDLASFIVALDGKLSDGR